MRRARGALGFLAAFAVLLAVASGLRAPAPIEQVAPHDRSDVVLPHASGRAVVTTAPASERHVRDRHAPVFALLADPVVPAFTTGIARSARAGLGVPTGSPSLAHSRAPPSGT
jgi:hypothetical protein